MYVVRDIFTAKPGCASKLANLFKRVFANDSAMRVLTDLVSDFNTVIMEFSVGSLAEYEKRMQEYKDGKITSDPELLKEMKAYTELWLEGKREVFQVV